MIDSSGQSDICVHQGSSAELTNGLEKTLNRDEDSEFEGEHHYIAASSAIDIIYSGSRETACGRGTSS
jgi:hypothetical protein